MILASWPVLISPDYRSDVVLSVELTTLDQASVSADVRTAATSQASRLARTNVNRPKPRHTRDNERDSNFDTPKTIRTVAKLEINKILRKPEDIRENPIAMETAVPIPTPATSNAAPFTGTQRQLRPLDKAIVMPSMVKFRSPVTTANTTTGDKTKLASAHIRGKLQTDLARYFSYPAIARQRGWQGHVRIGFLVQPDGKLTNIYITRSSGYRLLDKSALKALQQVEPLVEITTLLKGKSVDMELPVIYKLEQP
jgi:TonB family protein